MQIDLNEKQISELQKFFAKKVTEKVIPSCFEKELGEFEIERFINQAVSSYVSGIERYNEDQIIKAINEAVKNRISEMPNDDFKNIIIKALLNINR